MSFPRSRFLGTLASLYGVVTCREILPLAFGGRSSHGHTLRFTTTTTRFLPTIRPDSLLVFDPKAAIWEGRLQ